MHDCSMHRSMSRIRELVERRKHEYLQANAWPYISTTNACLGRQLEDALLVLLHQLLTSMEEMQVIQTWHKQRTTNIGQKCPCSRRRDDSGNNEERDLAIHHGGCHYFTSCSVFFAVESPSSMGEEGIWKVRGLSVGKLVRQAQPQKNGVSSVCEFWVALKKGTAFRAAPLGRSGRLPSLSLTFKRTSVCTPITMTEFRRYYRADRRPIPSKVGPAALSRPIPITWCERIF